MEGAIEHTLKTGELVGGSDRLQKGKNAVTALEKIIGRVNRSSSLSVEQKNQLLKRAQPRVDSLKAALATKQEKK